MLKENVWLVVRNILSLRDRQRGVSVISVLLSVITLLSLVKIRNVLYVVKGFMFFALKIDYDKKNCNPNNLITLCHGCHTKTGRNRERWINFFKKTFDTNKKKVYS